MLFVELSSSKQNGLLLQTESQLLHEQSKYRNECCVEKYRSSEAEPPNVIVTVDEPDIGVIESISDCPPQSTGQSDLSKSSEDPCNPVTDQVESSTDEGLSNVSKIHSLYGIFCHD